MEIEGFHRFGRSAELFAGPFGRAGIAQNGDGGGAIGRVDDQNLSVFVPIAQFDKVGIPIGQVKSLGDRVIFFAQVILGGKFTFASGKVAPSAQSRSDAGDLFVIVFEESITGETA